jgi:hypothetical protein
MNNEWKRTWNEAIMSRLRYCPAMYRERPKKTMKNFSYGIACVPSLPSPSRQRCYSNKLRLVSVSASIGCSFCRLIGRPEHIIGRHLYLPESCRSFIRWSPDQWVSQCYAIECDRSFYSQFCVFMTLVSQCSINLCAEHPLGVAAV